MLFDGQEVAAVIDYDAARIQPRVIDVANGVLQFSILTGDKNPARWSDALDLERLSSFLEGYNRSTRLPAEQAKAIPFLMCEAMIGEAALPIAATGVFGRLKGYPFLQMVERKVKWILNHQPEVYAALRETMSG